MIQNVMAKAQQLDKGETGPTINSRKELDSRGPLHQPDNRTNQFGFKSCSICHMREVGNGVGQECVECRSLTCHMCGALVPASHDASKNTEWMCKMCMKRTNVQPVPWQPPGHRNQQPGMTGQQQQPWDSQLRRTGSLERERGVYNSTMDDGRSHIGASGIPLSGTQSLPQSPRAQLRSQRSLDGALGGSLGGLTNAGRGTDLGRGRGVLGRPGSRESMFDSQSRDLVNSDFAPRNGITAGMDIDRAHGQYGEMSEFGYLTKQQQIQQQQQQHQQQQQQQQQNLSLQNQQSQAQSLQTQQNQMHNQQQQQQLQQQQQQLQQQQQRQQEVHQQQQMQQQQQHMQQQQQLQQQQQIQNTPPTQQMQQQQALQQQQVLQSQHLQQQQQEQLNKFQQQMLQLQQQQQEVKLQAQALQQQQQQNMNKTGRIMDLQGGTGMEQGMYGAQTSGPLGALGHGVSSMTPGMSSMSGITGLNNMIGNSGVGGIQGVSSSGMSGLQGMGSYGAGLGTLPKTSTAVSTATTSGTSISGMLADFSRALGLGNTSPRPSPSEERPPLDPHDPLAALHPPPLYGSAGSTNTSTTSSMGGAMHGVQHGAQHGVQHGVHGLGSTAGLTSASGMVSSQGVAQSAMGMQSNALTQQTAAQQQHLQQQVQQLAKQNALQQQQQQHLQQQLQQQLQMQQEEQMQQQYLLQEQAHQTQMLHQQLHQQAVQAAQQQHVVQQVAQTAVQLQQQAVHQAAAVQQQLDGAPILYPQHMTPAQQQMYQQQMQQQHQAQHLKKNRRSLPQQGMQPDMRQHQMGRTTHTHLSTSQPVTSGLGGTPMSTPQGTPVGTPRGPRDQGGDSSDTMSETDSQKSLRNRRKLPPIPADQEAAPLPCSKKRERKSHSADRFRSFSPLRQASLDGSSARSSSLMLTRPSASETNLRKITHGIEQAPRPGSALGLLQGSSVVSSTGLPVSTSSLYASSQMSDLASVLPPDLRHLLGPGAGGAHSLHGDSYSKTVPSYMQSLKDQLKEEMRADRRRLLSLDKERELRFRREREKFEALRDPLKRLEMQRKMASPVLSRSRKLRAHRRQLSDPKIHPPFSPITEDRDLENEYDRGYLGFLHKPPYKSYEYESIDDGHRSEWDPSHSYLSTSYAAAGGALRETAINSVLDDDRYFSSSRSGMRRSSEVLAGRGSLGRKPHRKPRSWHPSPYGSDEDDDAVFREEKKAKIKAEIARRRREIEVNDRLHEELVRLAKIRESAELGYDAAPGASTAVYASNELALSRHAAQVAAGVRHPSGGGVGPSDYTSSSVLKSIDELLLTDPMDYSHHRSRSPRRHVHVPGAHQGGHGVTEEDRSIERIASTFRTEDYTAGLYERLSDFSPLTDFTPHAMPLLPDMPTRSRKLLEDLGSSPITESVLALPQKGASPTPQHRDRSHSPKAASQGRNSLHQRHRSPSLSPGWIDAEARGGHRARHTGPHVGSHEGVHPEHRGGARSQSLAPQEYLHDDVKQPLRGTGRQLPQMHGDRVHRHHSQAQIHARPVQQPRRSQESLQSSTSKYNFPVNRFLLTRDPKDRSVAGNGLGMRVIGGKEIPGSGGVLGAFVARIYPGGVADRAGDIREGDQVLEWNGVSMTGKTFEEVQSILAQTQTVEEVEVVIKSRHCSSRSGSAPRLDVDQDRDRDRMRRGSSRHSLDMNGNASVSGSSRDRHGSSSTHDDGRRKYSDADALSVGTAATEPTGGSGHRGSSVTGLGELSLQVCYDKQAHILYLIVHKARNLPQIHSQGNMIPPDPYVKVYLLPGRNLENQRRTKACSRTQEPEWNQTMVYEGVPPEELPTRYLEVTTWNYDVSKPNPAMGGVLLDLSDTSVLDEEPVWYTLMDGPALQAALSRLTSKRTGSVSTSIYGSGTVKSRMASRNPILSTAATISGAHPLGSHGCHGGFCCIL